MRETYDVPVSPHGASGPVSLAARAQVVATPPNFYRLETSRVDLGGGGELLVEPLQNADGRLLLPDGPGPGIRIELDHLRTNVLDGFGG